LSGRNLDAPFQRDLVRSAIVAGVAPWLWLTFVAMAPIAEETLFRGFLFRGWSGPARGPWFPIAATALTWTAAHMQYNLIALSQVLAAGLAFGWVRWRTGSLVPTLLMHALLNAAALIATWRAIGG
jgi:membrane protease YdiL (CAAX protease family)